MVKLLFHKPEEKWSWQYINPEKLVKEFKTKVISDFRLNDINNGGEGKFLSPSIMRLLLGNLIKLYL